MTASGGSSGAEARTIVLRKIGSLDDDDLRGKYKYFDSGRDVVERVFTLIDEDSAVVVFTHAKFAEKALRLDHGDIIVSRLPTQIFSSVTAVIDRRVTQMFKSKKLWKEYKSGMICQYGVEIRKQHRGSDLEIFGGSLEVEQCKIFLEKIYKEHVPVEQGVSGDGKYIRGQEGATAGTTERDNEDDERCQSRESKNQRKTRGHARTAEGDTHESHGSKRLNGKVQREEATLSTDQHMAAHGSCGNEHDMAEPVRSTEREHSKMSTADGHSASRSSSYGYRDDVEMVRDNRESHQRNGSSTGEEPSTGEPREVYGDTTTAVSGQFYLITSTRVHIYVGDIRQLSVDVIVSPTDECLQNGSGMARAIKKAAGPKLTQECRSIIQRFRAIPVGLGMLTTAGDLPCKKVFHVVRPTVEQSTESRYLRDLYCAFTKSLEASKDYHSIAIPAICSGIFSIPMGDVSRIMHEAVSDFCHKQDPTSAIVDIHLVDTNAETVKLIQQEFDQGLHEDIPKSKTDKSSHRSSGITTKRSHVVTSSAVNGAWSTIDNNSRGSASRRMVSSSIVGGHSPSSAMMGHTSSGVMTGHSPGDAMMGHSPGYAMMGHSSGGATMGHSPGYAMTGHSPNGATMGHSPGGAMTGHSPRGATTGHSPGGAMTGHSISGAMTGHSPGGAMTGHFISGAMTGHSSSGTMTGHSPGGAMTGHSISGAMTGHSSSGTMMRHSPGGDMAGYSSSGTTVGHSPGGAMTGHSSSGATMGHFPLATSSQSYHDTCGERAHTSNLYPSLDQGDDIGDGARPIHGGTDSVTMKHSPVARTLSSDTCKSDHLGPSLPRRCVSSHPSRRQVRDITGEEDTPDANKECPICLGPFVRPTMLSTCKHMFCEICIKSTFRVKQECPICRTGYGIIYGTQPANGSMRVIRDVFSLPGYYSHGTIIIHYNIPDGIQTAEHPHPGQPYKGAQRGGLLPDNEEGRKVLKLLKRAFDQRLTFTVGRSMTTGLDNCVTWNDIHHKTSIDGGPTNFGYPDADYLERVTQDLAAKGIK